MVLLCVSSLRQHRYKWRADHVCVECLLFGNMFVCGRGVATAGIWRGVAQVGCERQRYL
jgi:hypothetical protein